MSWIKDIINPDLRQWEEFYRNRWQHDKVVRSSHGVNCTGSCSWAIYVKDGIVTWEMQQTDYPDLETGIPSCEPRGCQRGISYSWYIYSPIRVKYPYMRGVLIDLWRAAKSQHPDPVAAWESIVQNESKRRQYQQARGKGGMRRSSWEEVLEITAASTIYTIKKQGPDRVIGFSPIPAMSMLSYAGGSRFLQLMGGVNLSFYDWYSDLPNASPEVWGEQTDVAEAADWYKSRFIVAMGSNLNMTRTPDVHFVAEARHAGAKFVVFSPDFSQVAKYGDWWIPVNAGQDGAFWMAVNHVILKEFHVARSTPYFIDYLKRYSDAPFLVVLDEKNGAYRAGRMLNAQQLSEYQNAENAQWKYLVFDQNTNRPRMPQGTIGFRWQTQKGQWNLEMKDGQDGAEIQPLLTLLAEQNQTLPVQFTDFSSERVCQREVPVKYLETSDGRVVVTTIYDLLMAQFGVSRGLGGDYPQDYDDENAPYTPAWQEKFTGIDRKTVVQFAQEWAATAERTEGKCCIIIGAGINHWYHNNLMYRAAMAGLMLCGCVGRNGGGLNHYVGQEKLAPMSSWTCLAMALDWVKPPRLQNAPSFHYVHTDQWRYDRNLIEPQLGSDPSHTMDWQIKATKMGWLPFYPQFNRNSLELVQAAKNAGANTDAEIRQWIVQQLQSGELKFSIEDPDAPENWPRVWYIWRGNALMSSAKGHEYFLKHYLGTHTNAIAAELPENPCQEKVVWHEESPQGKLDLVVNINFRMDTSAVYSDVVLPTATWYEKNDLNSTDMHSYIHPLTAAVAPSWESKSDWDIFKALAEKVSELAKVHLPQPLRDIVAVPLQHDTPAEIAQPSIKDWSKGECEPIPGKTMPNFVVVERDYVHLYDRFISLGQSAKKDGMGLHGLHWEIDDLYDEMLKSHPIQEWNGQQYPSVKDAVEAANVILHLAPETNGEVAYRAFAEESKKVGLPLTDLAEPTRGVRYQFSDLVQQPRRLLNSPCWTGIMTNGRPYSAYCLNVERLVPWRTLTGRQHFYLDHEGYIAFEENLPTYKPKPDLRLADDLVMGNGYQPSDKTIVLNYLTPHGKWHIHSMYSENHRMLTLSRGIEPFWINDKDAESIGIVDNDWVEVFNDHGVVVTRAVVSARIPQGICIIYHVMERTMSIPKSPERGNRRAGGHNSLTRIRLKPVLMMGGYGQFSYGFNYWGPTGVNRDTFVAVRKLKGEPKF
ncbi:MAG: nitrate reductase subunit alpha [Oscillatoriaceae cyanobacterium]